MGTVKTYVINKESDDLQRELQEFLRTHKVVGFDTNPLSLQYVEEDIQDAHSI